MKIERELEKCGASVSVERFEEILIELLESMYPGHSIDALLSDPWLALRFCEYVRMECRATTLPSETICRRLANMRKRGVAPSTTGVDKEIPRANEATVNADLPLLA